MRELAPRAVRVADRYHIERLAAQAGTDTRLTNGPTEGRNLIIKQVKRQGFGYRNPDHYRLRVLYRCS